MIRLPQTTNFSLESFVEQLDRITYQEAMSALTLKRMNEQEFAMAKQWLAHRMKSWVVRQQQFRYRPDFYGKVNDNLIECVTDTDAIQEAIDNDVI